MHDKWQMLIPDYITGDLADEQKQALEAHLADCESCRAALLDWKKIAATTVESARARERILPPLFVRWNGYDERLLVAGKTVKERQMFTGRLVNPQRWRQPLPLTLAAVAIVTVLFGFLLVSSVFMVESWLLPAQEQGAANLSTSDDLAALFTLYVDEVWGKANLDALPVVLTADAVHHDTMLGEDWAGLDAIGSYVERQLAIPADETFAVSEATVSGDRVYAQVTMTAGEFTNTVLASARVADGKLAEIWYDNGTQVSAYSLDLYNRWGGDFNDPALQQATTLHHAQFIRNGLVQHPAYSSANLTLVAADFSQFLTIYHQSFTDVTPVSYLVVAYNDLVFTQSIADKVFTDALLGVQPTNQPYRTDTMGMWKVENGMLVEQWWYDKEPWVWVYVAEQMRTGNMDAAVQAVYNATDPDRFGRDFTSQLLEQVWGQAAPTAETFDQLYVPRLLFHYNTPEGSRTDQEVLLALHQAIRSAFPDATMTVNNIYTDENRSLVLFTWTGTQTGTFRFANVELPATNEVVQVNGALELDRVSGLTGRINEECWWVDFPFLADVEF